MLQFITSPEKFADQFNTKVLGAYREVTPGDIRLLTECGLVRRYGYYLPGDIQTVIGILSYEQLREKRTQKQEQEATTELSRCKLCGQALPSEPEDKRGRPREYCVQCEPLRLKQRYRKWRKKKSVVVSPYKPERLDSILASLLL